MPSTKKLGAGELSERVWIDAKAVDMDSPADGSFVSTFQPLEEVWAKVELVAPGREGVYSGALRVASVYRVTVRWRTPLLTAADNRLRWRDKLLDIGSVDDITMSGQAIILLCQEGLTRG